MLASTAIEAFSEDATEAPTDWGAPIAPVELVIGRDTPLFTRLEVLVIGIGERDRPALTRPAGRLAQLGRLLFGIEAPSPFADPRLEALRSVANALRHGRRPGAAVVAALASGITQPQIEVLMTRNHH